MRRLEVNQSFVKEVFLDFSKVTSNHPTQKIVTEFWITEQDKSNLSEMTRQREGEILITVPMQSSQDQILYLPLRHIYEKYLS